MNILNPLLSFLLLYKYYALFAVVYSAAVILPLPGNTMLLAVGAFSSQGYFNFWLSLTIAVVANTLGDLTDFGLTHWYGERVIRMLRLHRFKFYNQLQEELRTDAAVTVFITRFAGSLSPIASFLAGLVGVPFRTFLLYDFLGNLIEPAAALSLGYLVGDYWSSFSNLLEIIAAIVAVAAIMFVLVRMYRRMTKGV